MDPAQCTLHDRARRAVDVGPRHAQPHIVSRRAGVVLGQRVVVVVEALREAEARGQRKAGDEGARPPALRSQDLGQRQLRIAEHVGPVLARSVAQRVQTRKDRRVRRKRDRCRRDGVREPRAARGECVDIRRLHGPAIAAESVRPCRVERDHENVRSGAIRARCRLADASSERCVVLRSEASRRHDSVRECKGGAQAE
jgi:hypothetical protein